ncbi:MAG TPA: GGDEF domain-containing protein [Methylomirabilota bacterium]|nr:GGDEF domain-containing protein [Methylomirabilota bacterium]
MSKHERLQDKDVLQWQYANGVLAHVIAAQQKQIAMLEQQAMTDPLTQLPNRAAFRVALDREVALQGRHGEEMAPTSLLLVDIDNFKDINDNKGHQAGDKVLVAAADALTHRLRQADQAFRWAGDEFTVLLPKANLENAVAVADDIRQDFSGKTEGKTMSIGVCVIDPTLPGAGRANFKRADQALYYAKEQGRDQTATYDHVYQVHLDGGF